MDEKKYLDENGLLYYNTKLNTKLDNKVDKEKKTGKDNEYKVLSDNNLTDELVKKINDAGTSTFDGDYDNLTNKPSIDGTELSSSSTAEGLGLAKKEDIPTDYVSNDALTAKGYQTKSDVEALITSKVSSVMTYKGTVENYSDLSNYTDTAQTGDTYNITNASEHNRAGDNATFNGSSWDVLSGTIDLSEYVKGTDLVAISNAEIDNIVNPV